VPRRCVFFCAKGFRVVGLDNDLRGQFFGAAASTDWSRGQLEATVANHVHHRIDIRDRARVEALFSEYGSDLKVVSHTAAQPSHHRAA
jgi:CDP-paratose 2-epimerase